jgi:hypothetical protein
MRGDAGGVLHLGRAFAITIRHRDNSDCTAWTDYTEDAVSTTPPGPPAKEANQNRFSRQIDDAFESASRLAGSSLPPTEFYEKFLQSAVKAIEAPAGAVWLRTPQGFLQIACQVNLDQVGLDGKRGGRQCHNEMLRHIFQAQPPRPVMVQPQELLSGLAEPGPVPARNLTDYFTLFAPIVNPDKTPMGLLEIFQEANHDPRAYPTFLNYAVQMAGYASQYHNFSSTRQSAGLDKLFGQIESFSRLIHGSLNPTEVAYHIANEGRRLIECDRMCVGVRHGRKTTVEAVSGADVVEKAATHVVRMRALFDAVQNWGEKLVFKGEKDESLPPAVLHALDDYLAESQPKLLVVQPVKDEREKNEKKPARSVMLLEMFNPPENVDPIVQRLDVVGKHAASALYNAAELKKVPFKPLWWPVMQLQEGVGGKAKFFLYGGLALAAILLLLMIFMPAALKVEAKGLIEPVETAYVYTTEEGHIREMRFKPGDKVDPAAEIALLVSDKLGEKYRSARMEMLVKQASIEQYERSNLEKLPEGERLSMKRQYDADVAFVKAQNEVLLGMRQLYHLDPARAQNGVFMAKAPALDRSKVPGGAKWTLLNAENRDQLLGRTIRGNEPIQRLGYVEGQWHVVMKIPQHNMGQILKAFKEKDLHQLDADGKKFLEVDLLLTSESDRKYYGRIYQDKIAAEAVPNKDDHNESEQVVIAYVRINIDGVQTDKHIPRELFVTGQEVHAKIRCGDHALGYSLFHGVWEWFYEHVVFFF